MKDELVKIWKTYDDALQAARDDLWKALPEDRKNHARGLLYHPDMTASVAELDRAACNAMLEEIDLLRIPVARR